MTLYIKITRKNMLKKFICYVKKSRHGKIMEMKNNESKSKSFLVKAFIFFRGDILKENNKEVERRNKYYIKSFSIMGMVVSICSIIASFILNMFNIKVFIYQFVAFFIYFFLLFLLYLSIKNKDKHYTIVNLLSLVPLMVFGILMGTVFDPNANAITFLVLMCVCPVYVLIYPYLSFIFTLIVAVAFLITAYFTKPYEIYGGDFASTVMFFVTSQGISILTTIDRENSIVNKSKLEYINQYDALTKIYNRGYGDQLTQKMLKNKKYGFFAIADVDNFKLFNDKYGHAVGDQVLIKVANTLNELSKKDGFVARMGGDEFSLFINGMISLDNIKDFAESIIESINKIEIDGVNEEKVHLSIGITIYNSSTINYDSLYKKADDALYEAKRKGKDCYEIK